MLYSRKQNSTLRFSFLLLRKAHLQSHQQYQSNYRNNRFLKSMGAAYVPYFASEQFCGLPIIGKTHSYRSTRIMTNNFGFAFSVRPCFSSHSNKHNHHENCCRSLHSDSEVNSRNRNVNGFEYQKAQLVSGLEMEGVPPLQEVHSDAGEIISKGFKEAYQPGNPLGFSNHPSPQDKIVVAVDVDEEFTLAGSSCTLNSLKTTYVFNVLGNFVSALNKFIADHYSSNHSVSEYHVYEFFKIWNCSRDEADVRVHEFFKTPYFKTGIYPLPGAQKVLHNLSRFCDLSVVTSRQNAIKDHTIEWLEKHFPGLFLEIHFGNHFALQGKSRPKSEICRSLGAKVLIDDNPRYAVECAEVGIRVLLFDYENSYPWCKVDSINQHPLVTKVYNWDEVEQQLAKMAFPLVP